MSGRWPQLFGAALLVLCITSYARADVGTPLVWAEDGHLLFGNAILGLLEGLLIAVLFKTGRRRSILLMIAANYTSAIAGVWLFNRWSPGQFGDALGRAAPPGITLDNALTYHVCGLAFLLALTALLEWPFCLLILRHRPRPIRRSIGACLVAQFTSYALLCACYVPVSSLNVLTAVARDDPANFAGCRDAWIYYLGPDDGDLWRIHPGGRDAMRVAPAGILDRDACLFARPAGDQRRWELCASADYGRETRVLLTNLDLTPATPKLLDVYNPRELWMAGEPAYLPPVADSTWHVRVIGIWPDAGVLGTNRTTGEKFRLAMATPLLRWTSRNATVLPNNQLIYQLGDQIVLLDLTQRKIGLITIGRGPAVAIEAPAATSSAPG